MIPGAWSETLLSRVEDAGLNASAPPQQRWLDGWLLRLSPGKAKRARCVNALATGRLPLRDRLSLCELAFRDAGLPMFVRITPFTQPPALDDVLAAQGLHKIDDTRVMVATAWALPPETVPPGLMLERLAPAEFAEQVGELRGSPTAQRAAHAQRLQTSPVPYQGWVLRRRDTGTIAACGQIASEANLVGIYDVFTDPAQRGRGLPRVLCTQLLAMARARGAAVAYLQVESSNAPARAIYHRLGFADAYSYHYRSPDPGAH
jgi:ribosomal protein S18 acetylase RimI-like enzyme